MSHTVEKNTVQEFRKPTLPIDPLFINRWSPRSFLEKQVPGELLFSLFEAARWAASSRNTQPWKFILARSEEDRAKFYSFLWEFNLGWCKKAPVLVMVLSKNREEGVDLSSHTFDTGMATAHLMLQATKHGLITHFMSGLDFDMARTALNIPDEYDIHGVIAIGYQGEKEELPEALQLREEPSGRNELSEIVFEGSLEEKVNFNE